MEDAAEGDVLLGDALREGVAEVREGLVGWCKPRLRRGGRGIDIVVDRCAEEVVDDGEAAGARRAEHQRTEDDAVPVGDLLKRVGGMAEGVALAAGDAALLGIGDIRRCLCGGGERRRCTG